MSLDAPGLTLDDKIRYQEVAVYCAQILCQSIEVRGFDSALERQRLSERADILLDQLGALYNQRLLAALAKEHYTQ